MADMRRIASIALVAGLVATGATTAAGASPGRAGHPAAARTAHSAHTDAVAEAKRVLALSPTIMTETASASAPLTRLDKPPVSSAAAGLVTLSQFWTGSSSLNQTFAGLTDSLPKGMTFSSSGSAGNPVSEKFEVYTLDKPPSTIASAKLIIEVVKDGSASAIGAYAEVVPVHATTPAPVPVRKRPAREHVPVSVHTVRLTKATGSPAHVVKRRTRHGGVAKRLVRDFDALALVPHGATSCPAGNGTRTRVVFKAHGHTWRATYPICAAVAVTRDGHKLPNLLRDKAFTRAVKAALRTA
jgi:hypothetical protein